MVTKKLYIIAAASIVLVAWLMVGTYVVSTTFHAEIAHKKQMDIVYPITSCDSLMQVDMTDIGGAGSKITAAQETTTFGISLCTVNGTLAPAVNFQVTLPLKTWTQRYLQLGCGGLCGSISLMSGASDGCQVLMGGGFVSAATDMGHTQNDPDSWGEDQQKRADFAYRAQHITALAAKKLIKSFYGQSEKYSYFNGCSDGGREALMEAQRYPEDFDGIIAGAPAMLFQIQNTLYHGWLARSNTDENGEDILLSAKLPVLHQAVMDACDALDGVKDGIISYPAACKFDPATIQCPEGTTNTSQCLTAAEAEVVRKFYAGPQDPQTGAYLTAGQQLPGSELNWDGVYVAAHPDDPLFSIAIVTPVLRFLAFQTSMPNFTINDLQFTQHTLDALRPRHPLFDATNTKVQEFASSGRKLILWHGMADPHISPSNTVAYYHQLLHDVGRTWVESFVRLYLVPGMSHCMGGDGLNTLDLLTAMITWVEEGKAPNEIQTSNDSKPPGPPPGRKGMGPPPRTLPNMTRPIYPYPFTSQYTGQGDIYDGVNWVQGPPVEYIPTRNWYGADLFGYYNPINY